MNTITQASMLQLNMVFPRTLTSRASLSFRFKGPFAILVPPADIARRAGTRPRRHGNKGDEHRNAGCHRYFVARRGGATTGIVGVSALRTAARVYALFHPHGLPLAAYAIAAASVAMTALTTILTAVAYRALRPDLERAEITDVFA